MLPIYYYYDQVVYVAAQIHIVRGIDMLGVSLCARVYIR